MMILLSLSLPTWQIYLGQKNLSKAVPYILAVEKKFFKSVKVFYLANKPIATERKASFLLL